jgi:tetratricopeptide (TPR) repeat protein
MNTALRRGVSAALALALALGSAGCASRRNNSGALIGGASGAVVGGVIGSKSGSWGKGALIGAGAGALLGYVIANETDPKNDRYEPPPPPPPPPPRQVSVADPVEARKAEATRQFQVAMAAKDMATTEYHLRESIAVYPTPQAHNNLGLVHLDRGERDLARENFRAAVRLDPNYEPALQNLEKLGASGR